MNILRWLAILGFLFLGTLSADAQQPENAAEPPAAAESKENEGAKENDAAGPTDALADTVDALSEGDFSRAGSLSLALAIRYGLPALALLGMLIVAYFVASYVSRVCSLPIRKRVDETLGRFVGQVVYYLIMISAILGVLQYFGIGVSSFAAAIAAAGFAVGLAFQGTLSNVAAGVMLLVFRPFKVGDVVNAADVTGKIFLIDLFTTTFDTFDNRRIVVPNSSITSGNIENVTFHPVRRVDVPVGVEYAAGVDHTRRVLTAAAESLRADMIEGEDRGFQVMLLGLGDSSVNWVVRFWTRTDTFWPVSEKLIEAIKNHLDQAGIGIPFPQMDVHLQKLD